MSSQLSQRMSWIEWNEKEYRYQYIIKYAIEAKRYDEVSWL